MTLAKGILAILTVSLLSGCASGPSREDILEEQLRLAELRAAAAEKAKERENERLAAKLEDIPDWYLDPPEPDISGLYGVGTGTSNDLGVALKKARLVADYEVAQQLEQELSGLEQLFTGDSYGMSQTQYQIAIERFVGAVDMKGQEVADQQVSVIDGKYTAYVLSRLSFDQMDRMTDRQNQQQASTIQMKAAFRMLRERVEASQEPVAHKPDRTDKSDPNPVNQQTSKKLPDQRDR